MVAPNVTGDVLLTGQTSTASYVYTDPVQIYDADSFAILIAGEANPGSNTLDYKVQVSVDNVSPTNWSDWILETVLANDASFAQSYAEEAFRWVRIGVLWNTAGEDYTVGISTRREKVI